MDLEARQEQNAYGSFIRGMVPGKFSVNDWQGSQASEFARSQSVRPIYPRCICPTMNRSKVQSKKTQIEQFKCAVDQITQSLYGKDVRVGLTGCMVGTVRWKLSTLIEKAGFAEPFCQQIEYLQYLALARHLNTRPAPMGAEKRYLLLKWQWHLAHHSEHFSSRTVYRISLCWMRDCDRIEYAWISGSDISYQSDWQINGERTCSFTHSYETSSTPNDENIFVPTCDQAIETGTDPNNFILEKS